MTDFGDIRVDIESVYEVMKQSDAKFDPVRDEAILKNYRRLVIEHPTTQIIFNGQPTLAEGRETFAFRQRLREPQCTPAVLL